MVLTLHGMVKDMPDFYFSESGDIKVAAGGDIGMTETSYRDDAQQAYIRIMTAPGDFMLYRTLGADLEVLYGMPQSRETAAYGVRIIKDALEREGLFAGKSINITPIPTGPQTIRFDVYIKSGSRTRELLSIEKDLGIDYKEM